MIVNKNIKNLLCVIFSLVLGISTVSAASFHIPIPYTPSFLVKPSISLNREYIFVNVSISQLDSEYYPNCTFNFFIVNKSFDAIVFRYSKTTDFGFHQTKILRFRILTSKYKPGIYYAKWYLSCGGYPLIGNVYVLHFLSVNPLGLLVLRKYGGYIEFKINNSSGNIPSAYIDKSNFSLSGSFSNFAALTSIHKILLEAPLRGHLKDGYLKVEQCGLLDNKCVTLKVYNNITFNGSYEIKEMIPLKYYAPNYMYIINLYLYNKNNTLEDFWSDKICIQGRVPRILYSYLDINKTFVVFAGPIDPNYQTSLRETAKIVVYANKYSKEFHVSIPPMKKDGVFIWNYPHLVNKVCIYLPYESRCFRFDTNLYLQRLHFAEKLYKELMGSKASTKVTRNINIHVNNSTTTTSSNVRKSKKHTLFYVIIGILLVIFIFFLLGLIISKKINKHK